MKLYFSIIKISQELLLAVSVVILAVLPGALLLTPDWFSGQRITLLYFAAHLSLFFVMLIRPLADLFKEITWIRPLVILRKGMGVFSAAIIVSFILEKNMIDGVGYFTSMFEASYWSLSTLALFAHAADISAILLLITSNNLSKKLLGKNWKRIQRLSYVYFYGSGIYVWLILDEVYVFYFLAIVTVATSLAWLRNHNYLFIITKPQTS